MKRRHSTSPPPEAHRPALPQLTDRLPALLPVVLPIVLAVVMALVFRHPAMLMFGLMGPLLALSGSWGRKRDTARVAKEQEEKEAEDQQARSEQQRLASSRWRDEQLQAHPAVGDWLHNPLWRAVENTSDVRIRLGLGHAQPPSATGIDQPVIGVPHTVPLHTSVAVVGSGLDAVAAWRAVACQVLAVVSAPTDAAGQRLSVAVVWKENADLPQQLDIPSPDGDHTSRWCFVDTSANVPPQATWVLVVSGAGHARLLHRGVVIHDTITPDCLTFAQSRWVRARLVDAHGQQTHAAPLVDAGDRGCLWAEVSATQPPIDLVVQGPHALVWGKTGSGKSVLLHKLVTSLCSRYSPEQLAVVGIDFKGGATLSTLMAYPHGAGLLTDLTPTATARVTRSLRAEVVRREQLFADHHVVTWKDLPSDIPCPRVLIVVDEAGVVAEDAPELMAVLSDIASRGRSLGLHLLISTQRPQHLPRNIIANCALRLCLGVTDVDEARQYAPDIPAHLLSALRHSPPGTVVLPGAEGAYSLVTVDTASGEVSGEGGGQTSLWCEELPEKVTPASVAGDVVPTTTGYLVGLADYPDKQSREAWWYQPAEHGPLVIVGEAGSGHTTCLTHLTRQARGSAMEVVWAGSAASALASVLAWQLMGLRHSTATTPRPTLLVVDRLDRVLQGLAPEGQAWILDSLESLSLQLSERGDGSAAVVTTTPGSSVSGALLRWNATTCLLRHRDLTQWSLAGGHPSLHHLTAPPGRAVVGDVALQWCYPVENTDAVMPESPVAPAPEGALVVSSRQQGTGNLVVVSLSEAESRWQEIRHAIDSGDGVVFCDVPAQQMRQWSGPGHTTPPVPTAWPYGWLVTTGGVTLVTLES